MNPVSGQIPIILSRRDDAPYGFTHITGGNRDRLPAITLKLGRTPPQKHTMLLN